MLQRKTRKSSSSEDLIQLQVEEGPLKRGSLPTGVEPYPEDFTNYLDQCYWLMEEVWAYKRNLESVEDFWERVVLAPNRAKLAGPVQEKPAHKPKQRSKNHGIS
jgi:hypothetical protein